MHISQQLDLGTLLLSPFLRHIWTTHQIFSTSWGHTIPSCFCLHTILSQSLQVPIYTTGLRELVMVKCLAQGRKCHDQESNPHSVNSVIRTRVRYTRPLEHDMSPKSSHHHFSTGIADMFGFIRPILLVYLYMWLVPSETLERTPSLISVLNTRVTQHTGPTTLCPIRRTKESWLSVLLNRTQVS